MKKAKVIETNFRGTHPSGAAEEGTMELRAGAKGKGKLLHKVIFWPWSAASVDKADEIMAEAAQAKGYEIV